eukprot:TRINITY_DN21083_c0_g1_i1.p1 TRINITY_DN21083_c0_g1~~TRINITY_DN21083_c0_g1_i1.p1  ORF type:complete len:280 (-),score=60.68 TRINITY_DN21083_c0_g1_i1:83-865(-)
MCIRDRWDEIEKDTRRTRTELKFFNEPTGGPRKYITHSKSVTLDKPEVHAEVLLRILFIYAKSSGNGYVQGMNEILAPIYFCFRAATNNEESSNNNNNNSHDSDSESGGESFEADAYFVFCTVMEHVSISLEALNGRVRKLNEVFKKVDHALWNHFELQRLDPKFYSVRWLMLFLTQEFSMTKVLRLWDSLLAHPHKVEYLNYLCIAVLSMKREYYLKVGFSEIIESLQKKTGELEIEELIDKANNLFREYSGKHVELQH